MQHQAIVENANKLAVDAARLAAQAAELASQTAQASFAAAQGGSEKDERQNCGAVHRKTSTT